MILVKKIRDDLTSLSDPAKAVILRRFFKTGPGEYGYGDKFLGINVPKLRGLAKTYNNQLNFSNLKPLISSKIHEERLFALLALVLQYENGDKIQKRQVYNFYFDQINNINNWDLVDLSAPQIVGSHLLDRNKKVLHKIALSKNLWQRRIAIVSTQHFIRNNFFDETLSLSEKLLYDQEDLIHKACGWMLREVGKRDLRTLEKFLLKYYKIMPRTMLRYAIERFPQKLRLGYLNGKI